MEFVTRQGEEFVFENSGDNVRRLSRGDGRKVEISSAVYAERYFVPIAEGDYIKATA